MKRKYFDTEREALDFTETKGSVLDVYKKADSEKWIVEWDEPTFNELYPARAIEL